MTIDNKLIFQKYINTYADLAVSKRSQARRQIFTVPFWFCGNTTPFTAQPQNHHKHYQYLSVNERALHHLNNVLVYGLYIYIIYSYRFGTFYDGGIVAYCPNENG